MRRPNIPALPMTWPVVASAPWSGALLALVFVAFSGQAHAAPAGSGDDMDRFLADKGLLGQISDTTQSVTQVTQGLALRVGSKASELVVSAMGFLGVPYKRGGNSFEAGFDCSGFVRALYEQTAGLLLPRRAEQQAAVTQAIDKADLQPGDLVFFNTLKHAFSHVGIYVGEGKFIHSPRAGSAVRVEDMHKAYWTQRFDGARRVDTQTAALRGAAQD